jgi:Ca2+-transporting ATPase
MANEAKGLTTAEAKRLAEVHGPNEIPRDRPTPAIRLFLDQLKSPMVVLLLAACALSAALGERPEAIAIAAIVLLNAIVGFVQEGRAERSVLALRALTAPRARVLRDGASVMLPAAEVVPGDVLVLEAGDVVAADAKLLRAHALSTNEAPLTGESAPVEKRHGAPVPDDAPLAERADRVFMGTAVSTGTAHAEVTAIGLGTELGRIADLLSTTPDTTTPLQRDLEGVTRTLILICLGVVAIVAALGLWQGVGWLEVLLTSVSLAVAAVPEGLPAVVTIALAVGVQRMAKRHVLVRKLPAVETLGSATVICTDKTGTLTTGRMKVREVWGDAERAIFAAAACNDAELAAGGATGDPTEIALLEAAAEKGLHRADIERERPRVAEIPFDSDRRRMSVARADGVLYTKGALESLLPLARSAPDGIQAAAAAMAERGLRVLAIALGSGREERDLEVVGLVGIADPPRVEVISAIAEARGAGVGTVMITGDHPTTARAIARELELVPPGADPTDHVFARVTAADKVSIVRRLKERGHVVAMTGDGVNDAPAIREAHIGIAMGKTGSEVTREASDMVLVDENFGSIVQAIREGRAIYDNIRKTLVYLLGGNLAELITMFGAALLGLPLPLQPLQLLWTNLVTDGMPALALVTDPPEPDVLQRPPRPVGEAMLRPSEWQAVALMGAIEASVVISAYMYALDAYGEHHARGIAFSTLVFSELFRAFAARSPRRVLFELGAFTNPRLVGVVILSVALQFALPFVPVLNELFGLKGLSTTLMAETALAGLVPVSILEIAKLVRRLAYGVPG